MSRWYILNERREAVPVDVKTFADWLEHADTVRRVGRTVVGDVEISTVFLGVDHAFRGEEPELFETMVFPKDSRGELDCIRYSTWAEADAGHWRTVWEWKAKS